MPTTTHSESRAWEPDPDDGVDAPVSAASGADATAAADQAALAAFAEEWSRSTEPSQSSGPADHVGVDEPEELIAEPHRTTTAPGHRGIPGRGVIVVSSAAAGLAVLTDFALTGGLSMYFDLWFVVICLVGAMAVRRGDLFTTGVLAPLLFGGLIAVISVVAPATFAASGGFGTVFPTGLTEHANALIAGYGVALFTVACRLNARS
jgi:hypothetical protein